MAEPAIPFRSSLVVDLSHVGAEHAAEAKFRR